MSNDSAMSEQLFKQAADASTREDEGAEENVGSHTSVDSSAAEAPPAPSTQDGYRALICTKLEDMHPVSAMNDNDRVTLDEAIRLIREPVSLSVEQEHAVSVRFCDNERQLRIHVDGECAGCIGDDDLLELSMSLLRAEHLSTKREQSDG